MNSIKCKLFAGIGAIIVIVAIAISLLIINNNKSDVENTKTTINISVYNKENTNIYDESFSTDKKMLIDVLNDIDELEVKTEVSQYGAYITSIMGIEQGDNYYWSYYIDDEYATVGVSSCELEEGKNYNFKIEEMNY